MSSTRSVPNTRERWVALALAWRSLASEDICERCGAVAEVETDDGVPLCEGCAQ
jgi:hypothetical protein